MVVRLELHVVLSAGVRGLRGDLAFEPEDVALEVGGVVFGGEDGVFGS